MERVSLADLATPGGIVGGPFGSSLVGSDYVSSGVPVIRGSNMGDRFVRGPYTYVTAEKVERDLSRNVARPGDLVLTQRGTLGQTSLAAGPFDTYVISQSQMRVRLDPEKAEARFVYYAAQTSDFMSQIDHSAVRTGVPHINLGILGTLEVPLPPLPEQQAIAEVLGALDDKIAANRALVATIGDLMVAEVADLPLTGALTDLCNLTKKVTTTDEMPERVWHYSLPAFDEHGLPNHEASTDIKSNKFVVTKPSVLLSKLNPRFPRVWDIPDPESGAVASTEFLVLEPNKFSTSVLWSLLAHPRVSRFLAEHAAGTSGSHQRVKPSEVMELSMPTDLPASLQEELTSLGLRAESAKRESATLAALRDTLLPALMNGTLRVKDAERTVSEAL